MTTTSRRPSLDSLPEGQREAVRPSGDVARKGNIIVEWLTTTDHKKVGFLYLITSFTYFMIGGVLALIIRVQLAGPQLHVVPTPEIYN